MEGKLRWKMERNHRGGGEIYLQHKTLFGIKVCTTLGDLGDSMQR